MAAPAPASGAPALNWIRDATAVLESGPVVPSASTSLDPIDLTLDFASLVTRSLPGEFFDWIADGLDNFREILNDFTGDSAAIVAHADHCFEVAGKVSAQSGPVAAVPSCSPSWTGQSSIAYSATMAASADCIAATATSINDLGARHLVLAGMVAKVKIELIEAITKLAGRLVEAALKAIAQIGLALADGVVTIISGTVTGALEGAWDGLVSGGPIGAVSGLFGGAKDGAEEAAAEAARRLRVAFDNFVAWAGAELARVLEVVGEFVDSSMTPMVAQVGHLKGIGQRAERAVVLLSTGADPGYNAAGPQDGTAGEYVQGTQMQERDRDLIAINAAIGDPNAPLPDGYTRATPEQLAELGLTPDMLADENGFIAEVFYDPQGNPVVAFAGTTAGEAPGTKIGYEVIKDDVIEDAAGAVTQSPQTEQVLAISEALSNSPQADNVYFTGHSLGGRLASIASLDTGNAAVTYNSAGVPPGTVEYIANSNGTTADALTQQANTGQVRRYYTGDDPLTWAQERFEGSAAVAPDAVGYAIPLTEHDPTPFEGHQLTEVSSAFDEKYPPPTNP